MGLIGRVYASRVICKTTGFRDDNKLYRRLKSIALALIGLLCLKTIVTLKKCY
jgi:hypothetical protein